MIVNTVAASLTSMDTPGTLVFLTSGNMPVATLHLSPDAFGVRALGSAPFNPIERDSNATGGRIDKFSIRDGNGVERLSGTVTIKGGGGDLEVASVDVAPGQTVRAPSMIYTAPF